MTTFSDDLREMLDAWNDIESAAKREFPNATADELQTICNGAMNHALKLEPATVEYVHAHGSPTKVSK